MTRTTAGSPLATPETWLSRTPGDRTSCSPAASATIASSPPIRCWTRCSPSPPASSPEQLPPWTTDVSAPSRGSSGAPVIGELGEQACELGALVVREGGESPAERLAPFAAHAAEQARTLEI